MPVRIYGPWLKDNPDISEFYIKGIDYALANGADVISLSHQPIREGSQAALDQAISRAAAKGVTLVYIHYRGNRRDVVVSDSIEAAPLTRGKGMVYVIGTNFIEDRAFPFTCGLSQTAPLVAGVVALMKEVNPTLTPEAIRDILLRSGRRLPSGDMLLDARLALENGRRR